jgi:pantoate kinase
LKVISSSRAFCPAGVSSFFEICDQTPAGQPVTDLEKVGSRGGGFVIKKGVETGVEVTQSEQNSISVFINGKLTPEAHTSLTVAKALLVRKLERYRVTIYHDVEIPIGAGFGSSAGGALGTALALSEALDLKLTFNQLGKIAHVAEVQCKTGLGTVGPIMLGGCILTMEPGAPGVGIIDRLPLSPDHVLVAGTFEPIPTNKFLLSSPERRKKVSRCGRSTLNAILEEPSIENFLAQCLKFSEETGLITKRARQLVKVAEKAGAIGAAQNMIGEAVHALTRSKNAGNLAEAFKQVLPGERVICAEIDFQGARLLNT